MIEAPDAAIIIGWAGLVLVLWGLYVVGSDGP